MEIGRIVLILVLIAELIFIGGLSEIWDPSIVSEDSGVNTSTVCGDLELENGEIEVNYSSLKKTQNSHGLREEDFNTEKSAEYRILVLGDSYTYGSGINRSERYSDVLERKLNSRYSREIEVINAGYPGAGMKDYYLFLNNRGIKFEPDLVVVGFSYWDGISYNRREMMQKRVMETYRMESEKEYWGNEEATRALESRVEKYLARNDGNQSDIWVYSRMIEKLSQEKGFENILYATIHWPKSNSILDRLEECGVNVLRTPEDLELSDKYTLEEDLHYNPQGNKLLGMKLYSHLVEKGYLEE